MIVSISFILYFWQFRRLKIDSTKDKTMVLGLFGGNKPTQKNIDKLVEIYSGILGKELENLLDGTKELTENIARYYSESKRKRAIQHNS